VKGIRGIGVDDVDGADGIDVKERNDGVGISVFFSFLFTLTVYLY
jgi:hypothetical protein